MNYKQSLIHCPRYCILLLIVLQGIIVPLKSPSQTFPVVHYTEADGIINSTVYQAVQDSLGQMWFATRGGVAMYDGTHWKNYTHSDGLTSQNIAKIFIDSKNKLWAMQQRHPIKISLFNGERWEKKFEFRDLGIYSFYRSFLIDYDEEGNIRIYVGTYNDGLITYAKGEWKVYNEISGLNSNSINAIALSHDSLFIATPEGLSVLTNGNIINGLEKTYELPGKEITGLYWDDKNAGHGELIISGFDWLGKITKKGFIPVATQLKITFNPSNHGLHLLPYKNTGYYFGTEYIIYFYDISKNSLEIINAESGLITEGCTHMLFDRENNLWICSYRGINKISSRIFANYRKNSGLYKNEVTSLEEIEKGKILLGYNGALGLYDSEKFEHIKLDDFSRISRLHSRVQDMAMDEDGNIWIAASWQGLIKTHKNRFFDLSVFKTDEGANVNTVTVLDKGQVLFAAENILYTISRGKAVLWKPHKPLHTSIRKLFKDRKGGLYVSSMHEGLFYETATGWKNISGNPEECSNNVYAFIHDSKNRKIAGLIDGLFLIEDDSLVRFNPGGNRINNPIYLIFEDHKGRLWFGSDNGVYCWDEKKLLHFSIKEGLAGQEINRDAGLVDANGDIWLGTNNGLSLYREEFAYDTASIPPPIVKLGMAKIRQDTIDLHQKNVLPHNHNNLDFHFKAISFINEKDIQVQFKLDGFDKEFSDALPTYYKIISYNNLEPGKYRLHLKARNAIGVWSDEVVSDEIVILPPFYQTWWFMLLLILFLSFIIYWIFSYAAQKQYAIRLSRQVIIRTKQLKESQRELQRINKSREKIYSIIAHDLRSPFNSILGLTEILHKESVVVSAERKKLMIKSLYQTAHQTYFLLENLLNWVRSQRGDLNFKPQSTDLREHVKEIQNLLAGVASNKNIMLINRIKEECFVYADVNMLRTIIRNLLSNAIKFTGEGGMVEIFSSRNTDKVEVCIKDNGTGMTNEKLQSIFTSGISPGSGTGSEAGTGLGLLLCKEFVEQHGGTIKAKSTLHKGSEFCFSLPLPEDK